MGGVIGFLLILLDDVFFGSGVATPIDMPKIIARGLSVRQTEQLITRDTLPKPARVKPGKDADVRAFETEMTDAIGMRVRVTIGPDGRGQVVITVENWLQIEDLKARLTIQ